MRLSVRVRNTDELEVGDAGKVVWVDRVQWEIVGNRNGSDEGVVRTRASFSTGSSQISGDPSKGASRGGIERERIEVRFRLLEVCLSGSPLGGAFCDEWTD